jgi:hypothetical protein
MCVLQHMKLICPHYCKFLYVMTSLASPQAYSKLCYSTENWGLGMTFKIVLPKQLTTTLICCSNHNIMLTAF